jgi:hypothetical protein
MKFASFIRRVSLYLLFFTLPLTLSALEIYTLILDECKQHTGLIINTNEKELSLLNLDGTLISLKRQEVNLVLVYNIHNNPLHSLSLDPPLLQLLKEVKLNDQTHFVGWPIRFVENLIVFYDINGKTHLVDIAKIDTFSTPKQRQSSHPTLSNYKPTHFGLGDNLPECSRQQKREPVDFEPTRIIGDKIKIHKFFSVYQQGFAHLKRFQKKTNFYAKPFLYEKDTRMGYVYQSDATHELNNVLIPFYFQWSSGKPYSSQGEYAIGGKSIDLLPSVEPQLNIRSDVKSHFFTGTFIGNAMCLQGGNKCIIENRAFYTDFFSKILNTSHAIFPQFNHLALTGIDYKQYSLSFGFYYPSYGIWGNHLFREVVSTTSSPIFRFQRTTRDFQMTLIYAQSEMQNNLSDVNEGMQMIQINELKNYAILSKESQNLMDNMQSYDLKSRFLRLNLNYSLSRELYLQFGHIFFKTNYKERYNHKEYTLDTTHNVSTLKIKQNFSVYISLVGEVNHFLRRNHYSVADEKGDFDENELSYTISIEFLL